MGLGSTAKKVQQLADRAEQLYSKLTDLQERVIGLEETVDETGDRVTEMEAELRRQRALVEALADERGVDVETVLADVEEAEGDATDEPVEGDDATETPAETGE